jgi:glycosyltransferase involved in cell wall biosynthesis
VHICVLTPSFPPQVDGGVAIATGRLVESLLDRGHRLTVLTSAPPTSVESGVARLSDRSDRFTVRGGLVADPRGSSAERTDLWAWMRSRHRQQPFDIILAYFVYPAGYLACWLGERLRVPVVCSCRGNDISKDIFMAPETVAMVLQHSTHLTFVSQSLLDMADVLVPCRARATVIPNAVDAHRFVPVSHPPKTCQNVVTVGTSGVLRWKKGLDLLLPLIRALCADGHIRVLVAGYGLDAAVSERLEAFLAQHDLQPQVEVTGPLAHAQMAQALQRMDLYVSTSYQEGMPNGVLEAMACALPVVATDADGIAQLVEDGITGYLCRKGDLDTLVDRCRALIAQPELRWRLGTAGRQRVLQAFRPQQEAAAVERVLQQVMQSRVALR